MDKGGITPDKSSMTFGEMCEARDDETHPRHEEAVKASSEMAKTFVSVMGGVQGSLTRNPAPSGESSSREDITPKGLVLPGPAIDMEAMSESFAQAAQERAEREKRQDHISKKMLLVGWLTFIATIVSIGVTIFFGLR